MMSRILGMIDGKYAKTLAKIQVGAIFRICAMFEEIKALYGDAMLVPIWMGTNRNICYRILLQKREFIP